MSPSAMLDTSKQTSKTTGEGYFVFKLYSRSSISSFIFAACEKTTVQVFYLLLFWAHKDTLDNIFWDPIFTTHYTRFPCTFYLGVSG